MIMLKDEQATRTNVERVLNSLKQARPDDFFVIYIAAHGALIPTTDPKTSITEEVPYSFCTTRISGMPGQRHQDGYIQEGGRGYTREKGASFCPIHVIARVCNWQAAD